MNYKIAFWIVLVFLILETSLVVWGYTINLKDEKNYKICVYETFQECDYVEYDSYEGTCDCYNYDILGELRYEKSKVMN